MLGTFGSIIFSTSELKVLTPNGMSGTAGKRTTQHTVMSGKPLTEYLGPELRTFKFDINLNAEYGVKPRAMLDKLDEMAEDKKAYLLVIGGKPVGDNYWCLDSVSDSWDNVYSRGELSQAKVSLSLTEYIEDIT